MESDRSYACDRAWTARLSASGNPSFLSLLQGLFVGVVVTLVSHCSRFTLDAVLPHRWLLLGSIALTPFAIYNHHLVISPDHVLKFPLKGGACFSKSPLT